MDAQILIISKPHGLMCQEAPGTAARDCLIPRLAVTLQALNESSELYLVHRLDRETSGALLIARTTQARKTLDENIRKHEIERIYHGIVIGKPKTASGTLVSRLLEDKGGHVRSVLRGGREAITHYSTIRVMGGVSVLVFRLETGRRNQIRVQLADIGYPLLGDRKYGQKHQSAQKIKASRSMLHASALSLPHPGSGSTLSAHAPFPPDFRRIIGEEMAIELER